MDSSYYHRVIICILLSGTSAVEQHKKNYYVVTGCISAGSQNLSNCSLLQDFESENGQAQQVVAKNNLYHCKEHIQHYNISKNWGDTLSLLQQNNSILDDECHLTEDDMHNGLKVVLCNASVLAIPYYVKIKHGKCVQQCSPHTERKTDS